VQASSLACMDGAATPLTLAGYLAKEVSRPVKRLRRVIVATGAAGAVVLAASPVAAHGDITTSSPQAGAAARRPPRTVTVDLAEPPADGSTLVVTDPCGDEVSGESRIEGDTMSAPISGGSAGRWKAQVRSISSVDGHLVRENFSFRVRGQRDCSGDDEAAGDDGDDGDDVELGEPQPPLENDETSFPMVPFAVGTVVVVAAALALRRSGRKP